MSDPVAAFLARTGCGDARVAALAGDASARSYLRLSRPDGATAVLMQAPVATEADRASLAAVMRVNAHLGTLGLSAPATLAEDTGKGLLLQEDFGDTTLARLLADGAVEAAAAYTAAADVLDRIATAPVPDWAAQPDTQTQAAMLAPTLQALPDDPTLAKLPALMAEALKRHAAGPPVLALRDYHADNLIWLPDRDGPARIGLLDVQDAVGLPFGYDLASLLDDPRRDVPEAWRAALTARFAAAHGLTLDAATARLATLSLLRNLRILGIFRRLSTTGGKPRYAGFLPRTGQLVDRAAAHPALKPLQGPVAHLRDLSAFWPEVSPA
jgi:aminoglycoside/choline kinase family phosphotransferase